jgi:penicillin-binding protein 1A
VEIWSRFMKVAHQNQQIADLPGLRSNTGWFGAASGPTAAATPPVDRQAPVDRLGPVPVASANNNVRPEADRGLDGWFLQRLFGRR